MNATRPAADRIAAAVSAALDLQGPGGMYLRVSDDKQDVETQRQTAIEWLIRHGIDPAKVEFYIDVDWSRDETDRRPEWLRMLADIDAGRRKWIGITAKDRFGTASGRRKVLFYARLWDAGCKLYLTTGDQLLNAPDFASDVVALSDGNTEEQELRTKSERALDKMRQHAAKGRWMGGTVPPGLDVVCTDITGREFWRVQFYGDDMRVKINPDRTRQRYDGPENFPGRDPGQFLTLRPSLDAARVQLVLDVYTWFMTEALSTYQIAARLNEQGRPYPNGGVWRHYHIDTMLRSMTYLGIPTWNKTTKAKWHEFTGGRLTAHKEKNTRIRRHDRADWIIANRQFEEIVPQELFDAVQAKLGQPTARAPKSADLWLSGLLFCANCGAKLHGTVKNDVPQYICANYLRKKCRCHLLKHADAEGWVREFLEETAALLPTVRTPAPDVSGKMQAAWEDAMKRLAAAAEVVRGRVTEWARNNPEAPTAAFMTDVEVVDPRTHEISIKPYLDVSKAYRHLFSGEQGALTARRDQLDTEHTALTLALVKNDPAVIPNERAKRKVQDRIDELDRELADIESRLKNAADAHQQAREELNRLLTEWEAAREALNNDSTARQRADAVRKVIGRIDVTFNPTGRRRPQFYAAQVVITAVGAETTPKVRNVGSAGPTSTRSGTGTRGSACATPGSRSTGRRGTGGWS